MSEYQNPLVIFSEDLKKGEDVFGCRMLSGREKIENFGRLLPSFQNSHCEENGKVAGGRAEGQINRLGEFGDRSLFVLFQKMDNRESSLVRERSQYFLKLFHTKYRTTPFLFFPPPPYRIIRTN